MAVVAIRFGGGADVIMHLPTAHDDGDDTWNPKRPGLIVAADTEHEAAAAGTAEQIAVEEEGPPPEHGLFGQASQIAECAVDEFFEAGVAGHWVIVRELLAYAVWIRVTTMAFTTVMYS